MWTLIPYRLAIHTHTHTQTCANIIDRPCSKTIWTPPKAEKGEGKENFSVGLQNNLEKTLSKKGVFKLYFWFPRKHVSRILFWRFITH